MRILKFLFCLLMVVLLQPKPLVAQKSKELKILNYNVLRGFSSDTTIMAEYIDWVKEIDPDIVCYQEMNFFTQKTLETFAGKYGHRFATLLMEKGFPVAISSKYPIVNVQKVLDNMHFGYIHARVKNIDMFVVHLSPFDYKRRQVEVETILTHNNLLAKKSQVFIVGDFNSYSPDDSSVYPKDYVSKFGKKNVNNGAIDYSVIELLKSSPFKDVYRFFHTEFSPSFPTKRFPEKFPRRIDYMWANKEFVKKCTSVKFIYDKHTDSMSDHYPLLVTVKK